MIDIGNHNMNLPWKIDPNMPGRIIDSNGIPVAFGSSTTSIKSQEGNETIYRTTETVAPVRARIIVDAVNKEYGQ